MGNTSRSSSTTAGYDSINNVVDVEINNNKNKSSSFCDDVADNDNDNDATSNSDSGSSDLEGQLKMLKKVVNSAGWDMVISRRLIIATVVAFVLTTFFVRTSTSSGGHIVSSYDYKATATTSVTMDAGAGASTGADADADAESDAAIVSFGEENPGGCRTTGQPIPHDSKKPIFQPFGEPMLQLNFKSDYYYKGPGFGGLHDWPTYDEAWQGCAKQCNWDAKCHTYTVNISQCPQCTDYYSICYLHNPYLSKAGTSGTNHVSGVCRLNLIVPSPIFVPPGHTPNPNDPFDIIYN